ncbi:MAG: S41 family peptidase [Chloroflexi bacterium]|nr:S41 family peptidase [Chloroflexota bacterium]
MQLRSRSSIRPILLGIVVGLVLALVFFAGFFVRDLVEPDLAHGIAFQSSHTYALLSEVQNLLDRHYLREQPGEAARHYGAVRGLLATLNDRYTFFIEPPVAASESDVLAGTYGGIGVQVSRTTEGQFVLFPFEDSPASRAGILNGDILKAINGQLVSAAQSQDAIDQLLRGEVKEGNGVELTVVHVDGSEQTLFILFDVINVPSVIWRVLTEDSSLGYVKILRFTSRTPEELTSAFDVLREEAISGVVLDLRGNAGGLLQESIDVADEFLDNGTIVYQVDSSSETEYEASSGGAWLEQRIVTLVDNGTASGAELVAGALRDNERGILIGQRTYGKGTVQQIFPLSDRSSLHITSAEWFTPSRRALDSVGLEPDIMIENGGDGRDAQLAAAIQHLQTVEVVRGVSS